MKEKRQHKLILAALVSANALAFYLAFAYAEQSSSTSLIFIGLVLGIAISLSVAAYTRVKKHQAKAETNTAPHMADHSAPNYLAHNNDLLNQLDIGVVIVDPSGKLLTCNRSALSIFNLNTKLKGFPHSLDQAIDVNWKPTTATAYQMTCLEGKDKDPHVIEYITKEIANSFPRHYLVIIRDVTQRIQVDSELANYRVKLEDLVEQRSLALAQARDRAIAAHQEKNTFLANMTHELRTPLNAIIGYSELLGEDIEYNGHDEYMDDIKKIHFAAQTLTKLINDVLEIQELEEAPMQLSIESINIVHLIEEAINDCEELIKMNSNKVVTEIEHGIELIEGDESKIKKILYNLVNNAAKFTKNNDVTIKVTSFKNLDHDYISIAVHDKGIGISPDHISNIFKKFTQVDDSTTRRFDGAGLGLSISKNLALIMGGDISVDSQLNKGSSFTFTLPVNAIHSEIDPASIRMTNCKTENEKRKNISRVHIIDENVFTRTLFCRYLSQHGFDTTGSTGIDDAQPKIAKAFPDVLLVHSDNTPEYAAQIVGQLKELTHPEGVPTILISDNCLPELLSPLGLANNFTHPIHYQNIKSLVDTDKHKNLLIIKSENDNSDELHALLDASGINYHVVDNSDKAIESIKNNPPSMALFDLPISSLPASNSTLGNVIHLLQKNHIPIAIISGKKEIDAKNQHLNGMIEHFIDSSPCGTPELLMQIKEKVIESVRGNSANNEKNVIHLTKR